MFFPLRVRGVVRAPWRRGFHSAAAASSAAAARKRVELDDVVSEHSPETNIHGFKVLRTEKIQELALVAVYLQHVKTGALYLHCARNDRNNVFGVGFRTTPMDSTGVAHILEHTVLCGSEMYPIHDPFFKMLNRSLATFMNAMTGADFTVYPFSTQNPTDFENLRSVYLDAVFRPRLRELDFKQEGWRLEHENPEDPSSPIVFKGVVFNEMKGVFADSQTLFAQKIHNALLPSHTYGHCSGGDPLHIPDLTWLALRQFHASHYHPSNARFYSYGDIPLETHLKAVQTQILDQYDRIDPDTAVPSESPWRQSHSVSVACKPDTMAADPDKQSSVVKGYLMGPSQDPYTAFKLEILGELLVSGPNALFYKTLLEPQIGSGFASATGMDTSTKDATFVVGLQGIKREDADRVLSLIDETLKSATSEGFPPERVASILHKIELSLKHQQSNFGLAILLGLIAKWNHIQDPTNHLQINQLIDRLKAEMKECPRLFEDMVEKYFLQNPHVLVAQMTPDPDFEKREKAAEEALLRRKVEALGAEERKEVLKMAEALQKQQNKEEDLSVLPILKISEIERTVEAVEMEDIAIDDIQFKLIPQPTNGVTYIRGLLSTRCLPEELRPYVPLFCDVITRMGAGDMDYKALSQAAELKTGGLSVSTHLSSHPTEPGIYEEGILFSTYCLNENFGDALKLWNTVFLDPKLEDLQRLSTLLKMGLADLVNGVPFRGHLYAMRHAGKALSPVGQISERYAGLEFIQHLKKIVETDSYEATLDKIKQIGTHIWNKSTSMRGALNTTPDFMDSARGKLNDFICLLPGSVPESISPTVFLPPAVPFVPLAQKHHVVFPFPVNFSALTYPLPPYNHPDYPIARITAPLVRAKFLHREVREKGGAYGGGATLTSAGFTFYSYRDPNSLKTFETYQRGIDWLLAGNFNEDAIHEAKLSEFQKEDSPIPPGSQGMKLFLESLTPEMRNEQRERMIAVDKQQIVDFARRTFTKGTLSSACLIGPETKEKEKGWTVVNEQG